MRDSATMTIEDVVDAIQRLHGTTFEVWEGNANHPTWDYVEEALDDVCARLVLRYAETREAEATREVSDG